MGGNRFLLNKEEFSPYFEEGTVIFVEGVEAWVLQVENEKIEYDGM